MHFQILIYCENYDIALKTNLNKATQYVFTNSMEYFILAYTSLVQQKFSKKKLIIYYDLFYLFFDLKVLEIKFI